MPEPMLREIRLTADGSHTIAVPGLNVTYHSHHGAIQESMHVFIHAGLMPFLEKEAISPIRILEVGFGTGLNALLTLREAGLHHRKVEYTALEKYPLVDAEINAINYGSVVGMQDALLQLHSAEWDTPVAITPYFSLEKRLCDLPSRLTVEPVHIIYFDAFAPDVQPELWSQSFFKELWHHLHPGGVLVTYSSKGIVRRAMAAAGFVVEKIPGPRGKREMVRASRPA